MRSACHSTLQKIHRTTCDISNPAVLGGLDAAHTPPIGDRRFPGSGCADSPIVGQRRFDQRWLAAVISSRWLTAETGNNVAPAYYAVVAAIVSLLTILTVRETAGRPLR